MDIVEHFLISLGKEGLFRARVELESKEYVFSKDKGIAKVDVRQRAAVEAPTDKRVPVLKEEQSDPYLTDAGSGEREGKSLKYIGFALVFVAAAVLLVVGLPYLNKKAANGESEEQIWLATQKKQTVAAYQKYLSEFPEGKYAQNARMFIESQSGDDDSGEEKFNNYMNLAETAFRDSDYTRASHNLSLAKAITTNSETEALELKIKEKIAEQSVGERYSQLLKDIDASIRSGEVDTASTLIAEAKDLKEGEEIESLEKRLEEKRKEIQAQTDSKKRDEVFNKYLGFARNYYGEGNYQKALEHAGKAKKLKTTSELTNLEKQIKAKMAEQRNLKDQKKTDELYGIQMKTARDAFNAGKYAEALTGVRQAKKIKNTSEARKLEQDIVRVSDGLKDEQKRVADEKRRKNEKEYNRYFKRAQVKFRKENYRAAKKDADQAKRYMKTKDLDSLEQRINLALRQSVQARIVKLIDLPSGMVNKYNEMIKHIEVANIGRGVKALGQIGLTLQVQQNGQLSIQRVNDQQMTVTPARSKRSINAKILRKITSIYLSPPIDKMGKSVVVRDWRVSYTVGTFMGKIILRRKF